MRSHIGNNTSNMFGGVVSGGVPDLDRNPAFGGGQRPNPNNSSLFYGSSSGPINNGVVIQPPIASRSSGMRFYKYKF